MYMLPTCWARPSASASTAHPRSTPSISTALNAHANAAATIRRNDTHSSAHATRPKTPRAVATRRRTRHPRADSPAQKQKQLKEAREKRARGAGVAWRARGLRVDAPHSRPLGPHRKFCVEYAPTSTPVCVCVCVCVCACVRVSAHVRMYQWGNTYGEGRDLLRHARTHLYICMHTRILYIWVCVYVCNYTRVCASVYLHALICTHTRILYISLHICMHTRVGAHMQHRIHRNTP